LSIREFLGSDHVASILIIARLWRLILDRKLKITVVFTP
jgi:hypothetical protein